MSKKASNINELARHGVDVPNGFHLDESHYREAIWPVRNTLISTVGDGTAARRIFSDLELPARTIRALEEGLNRMPLSSNFAVRSSGSIVSQGRAIAEDGRDISLLLYKYQDCFHFPLIRRMYNARDRHSGEVSLPGGSQDSNESIQETALRETEEEIGVVRDKINVLGTLSPMYIPPSNFLVTPTVAEIDYRPDFQCNRNEVAELFEVPLSLLLEPNCCQREQWELEGIKVTVPFYQTGSLKVWGATAMILSEFSMLIAKVEGIYAESKLFSIGSRTVSPIGVPS
jgi:8-oxo-dGTP pyrophosphatase MutT (NUDIX family)